MERQDFKAEIYENGFLLYYLDHLVGGEGIPNGTPVRLGKSVSRQLAEQRITEIIGGYANNSYMVVVGSQNKERMRENQCCLF